MRPFITLVAFAIGYVSGGCLNVRAARAAEPVWEWRSITGAPEQISLYRDGEQYGNWHREIGKFYRRTGPGKFEKSDAPADAQIVSSVLTAEDSVRLWPPLVFGVDVAKLNESPRGNTISGKPVSQKTATEALEGAPKDGIPDDSAKTWLTLIGKDADRQRVLAAIANDPSLKALTVDMIVKDLPPDRWELKAGHVTTGTPTIYLQAPDLMGRYHVVWRQDDYSTAFALAEAIRDTDPHYNPALDPQPRPPAPPIAQSDFDLPPEMIWLIVAVAVAAIFVVIKKGKVST